MITTHHEVNAPEEVTPSPPARGLEEQGNWILQKDKLVEKFGLTYAELSFKNGKKDEMLARLQMKLGISKSELQSLIAAL